MTDDRFERDLRMWLDGEAASLDVPAALRRRVAAIPAALASDQGLLDVGLGGVRLEPVRPLRPHGIEGVRMHGLVRLALAAAVVIAAVGGFMLLPGLGRVAAPSGSASPAPSGSPCPWRNPFPPEAVEACRTFGGPLTELLEKNGSVVVDGVPFSFKVRADGWEQFGGISINKSVVRGQAAEALIYWTAFPSGAIAERCFHALWKPIGPSITDAADAIAEAEGVTVVARSDVQVGGRSAKYVEMTIRNENTGCDPGYFHLWAAPPWGALWLGPGDDATIRVWVVDVDGVRLFIAGETTAEVDPAFGQEIQYIIDSIRFE